MKRLLLSAVCAAATLALWAPDSQAQAPGNSSGGAGGPGAPRRAGGPEEHTRQIISKYDKDGDHALNAAELAAFFEALRQRLAEHRTPQASSSSSSGTSRSSGSTGRRTPQEQAARALEKFDKNGDGKLEAGEIVALLRAIREREMQEHGGQHRATPSPSATGMPNA